MKSKTILFVALPQSIHVAHWLNLVAKSGDYEIMLYPALYAPRHPSLNPNIKVFYPSLLGGKFCPTGSFHKLRRLMDRIRCCLSGMPGGSFHQPIAPLLHLIREHKPHIVHGLEFQHCSYLAHKAMGQIPQGQRPKFGVTNWGSDVYHFEQQPEHLRIIKSLLASADFYTCECARDIELVKSLGFTGKIWPIIPGSGGLDMDVVGQILKAAQPPSARKSIMIKGYQHFAGRALSTLEALRECVAELRPYSIVVFSASENIKQAYQKFAAETGLNIEFIAGISQRDMLTHYSKSRCFIATGVSDGISTSVLEAMSVGCLPIQSDSACCQEWFEHGKTGFATSAEEMKAGDVSSIVEAIKQALSDDTLVDNAAPINQSTIASRASSKDVQKILLSEYAAL